MPPRLAITALVVGLNEGRLLAECLPTIAFCNELIYIDLGSNDDSVEIAEAHGGQVVNHPKVPAGEWVQAAAQAWAKNDWILFIDPDERLDENLQLELVRRFSSLSEQPDLGAIAAPWQFYFKNRPLRGTAWGGRRPKKFLANRRRFLFTPDIHRGRKLKEGFQSVTIDGGGQIDHYWGDSWRTLIRKHWRYVKMEGWSRYRRGDRITLGGIVVSSVRIVRKSYGDLWDGRDGYQGFLLSLLWITYNFFALVSLWVYPLTRSKKQDDLANLGLEAKEK